MANIPIEKKRGGFPLLPVLLGLLALMLLLFFLARGCGDGNVASAPAVGDSLVQMPGVGAGPNDLDSLSDDVERPFGDADSSLNDTTR
ncbi:MAG TPA: hypothetical protein VD948_07210, partial [Rhodothermales bacterium]|nr:hypothetical protein [Rhodothermales bacterium]